MKKEILLPLAICLLTACTQKFQTAGYDAEARACWIDRATNEDWDTVMASLSSAGFNMVLPNMLSSGSAYYKSEYVPMISEKDELKECLEAAHRYGIEVHVWKVNWALWNVNPDTLDKFKKQERIQVSYDNKGVAQVSKELGWNQKFDWLCPSHKENRELEKNLMMELVKKYDVDGVHFDYMRFPYEPLCYCNTCRKEFTQQTGLRIDKWPDDVWKGGKYREIYLDWRRELITSSAREIAAEIHRYDPYVCVSLAARSDLEHAYNSDAQEWWKWDDEGILDFVCPMNYTPDPQEYVKSIEEHFPLVKGSIPYYGGIGLFMMRDFSLLKEAIEGGRQKGQDGFTIFSYEWGGLREMLDTVSHYLGNKNFTLLPHRSPEVSFYMPDAPTNTAEGFPVYLSRNQITSEVVIMMKAKLREGINRIQGDIKIQDMEGNIIKSLQFVNLLKSERIQCTYDVGSRGRYRLILTGFMELSDGQVLPFVSKGFPFEIR